MRRLLLLLDLLTLLLPIEPAEAQTAAEVAANWGLLGVWRFRCNTPPSRNDNEINYAVRDGRLYMDRDWGSGRDSGLVTEAAVLPDGALDLTIVFPSLSQTRQNVFRKIGTHLLYPRVSRNIANDEHSTRDGRNAATGQAANPLVRFRATSS